MDTYTRTIPLHISFYLAIRSYRPYFVTIFQWAIPYDLTNRLTGRDSRRAVIGYATNSPRQLFNTVIIDSLVVTRDARS